MTSALPPSSTGRPSRAAWLIVAVAALGYFVDIYDLLLFAVVRVPSLRDLGHTTPEALLDQGTFLVNMQMAGLLVGGFLWGSLGDRRGRRSVLFGSILLYSVANLANGLLVHDVTAYAVWRFIAGIGLAGELGAGVTLVAETMPRETRGLGTTVVAGFGVLGAVVAGLVGDLLPWRTAYVVGGAMGLALLLLRVGVMESGMFAAARATDVARGRLAALVTDAGRLRRYAACIAVGLPIWYAVGLLVLFAPEFARALGVQGEVKAAYAVLFCYLGLSPGDVLSGLVSQRLRSRTRAMGLFIALLGAACLVYLFVPGLPVRAFYGLCFAIGLFAGYWAVFMANASEQFGTNLRATVTTTVPNVVRGAVVPMTLGFNALRGDLGLPGAALVVGVACTALAVWALTALPDRFSADLDYVEPL